MRYSELTKSQKLCIDEFIKFRPELATAKSISRQEVEEIWKALYELRDSGGAFFGYPMWLQLRVYIVSLCLQIIILSHVAIYG
jgi:hypothetical protein